MKDIVKDNNLAKDHPCHDNGHDMELQHRMWQGSLGFWKCKRCGHETHSEIEYDFKNKIKIREQKKSWE